MSVILVTGGTGFLGRHVLPLLLERGHEVHAVTSRHVPAGADGTCWHQANLLDTGQSRNLVAGLRPTHLLHLAWYAVPGKFWMAPENLDWAEASLVLFREFVRQGGKRLVAAGTCAEYDWSAGLCREDSTPIRPATPYGMTKQGLHMLAEALAALSGVSLAWGRLFFLYGAHESPARLVPSVVNSLVQGRSAPCTDGEQQRDFLNVADAAHAFVTLLESNAAGAFNVASGIPTTVRSLVEEIGRQTGRSDLLRFGALPRPAGDPPLLVADVSRIESLGWRVQHGLADGLAETIAWWRSNPPC